MENSVVLVDSFSSLCHAIEDGLLFEDSPNTLYFFGAMKQNVEQALNGTLDADGSNSNAPWFKPLSAKTREKVREIITTAENEDEPRIFWRPDEWVSGGANIDRFISLLYAIKSRGGCPSDYTVNTYIFGDAYWNIPEMRRYFTKYGIRVQYAFSV
jgi:hypothetical protein